MRLNVFRVATNVERLCDSAVIVKLTLKFKTKVDMKYKVQITDEAGNVQQYIVSNSSSSEEKSMNDFILELLQISEEKRKLPLKIQCPNCGNDWDIDKVNSCECGASVRR